ncbi:hypothetical protein [Stenoxybacter acetivorans]|uniref:hypothetical protein n=1 Tax=Stenoxybacter acetivorans TaxID=422441 RepID=UPI0012EB4631|nr:hypothetical protein [Stenoxybacter acetivorans]
MALYFSLPEKKKTKVKFLITAVIVILLGYSLYRIYTEINIKPYRYWYQFVDKNPKPWNVSFEEFSRRNREGYCWADKKTYTKEELKEKAIVSYIKMELLKMKSLREGWIREAGGGYEERSYLSRFFFKSNCGKFQCKVLMISPLSINRSSVFEKAQKLMQESVQKNTEINQEASFNLYDKNRDYLLSELHKVNSIEIKDNHDFLSHIKNHNDLIVAGIEKSNKNLFLMFSAYSLIISSQDKGINQGKFSSTMDEYFPDLSIPKNIDIHNYGVGLYYFSPKKINLHEKYEQEDPQKYGKKILFRNLDNNIYYPINNCGDLLVKPVYFLESR